MQPLEVDSRLTGTARDHSEDMRDGRFFGHRSPTRGELSARTRETGPVRKVAENIAMSVSITWAHDGLIASPSHRRNLLDPEVTHLGVGVASRDTGPIRVVYVTQHLARY